MKQLKLECYDKSAPTPKQEQQQLLLVEIKTIIGEHGDNHNYGVKRILLAMSQRAVTTSYSFIYRIMKKHGLLQKVKCHPKPKRARTSFRETSAPQHLSKVAIGYYRRPLSRRQAPMGSIKSIIIRYIMVYYNKQRICTSNPGGRPAAIYRKRMLSNVA
ncbi:hypothetical protein ACX93W_21420 [Paenibacillus sp. CAU 1782]